jgi:hypothetical protein
MQEQSFQRSSDYFTLDPKTHTSRPKPGYNIGKDFHFQQHWPGIFTFQKNRNRAWMKGSVADLF